MKKIITLILVVFSVRIFSQTEVELFPDKLNIQPFIANTLEPKVGTLFQLDKNELRLDIGNSLELIQLKDIENNSVLSAGADFFTYTLLRSEKKFHFPVDAVDYLFGINLGYKRKIACNELGVRFRLSHISAHFVDGHFDSGSNGWREGRSPRVYSREFIELMPYYKLNNLRTYVGYTYIFHIDPTYLGKNNFQVGFDYFVPDIITKNVSPFIGYDLKFEKVKKYSGINSINAGIKIGYAEGKGISIYYNYYSGKSLHGEYFDYNKNYSAIGFNLDL